jgi:hypothetical protein
VTGIEVCITGDEATLVKSMAMSVCRDRHSNVGGRFDAGELDTVTRNGRPAELRTPACRGGGVTSFSSGDDTPRRSTLSESVIDCQ